MKRAFHICIVAIAFLPPCHAQADGNGSGWSISLNCENFGSSGTGAFSGNKGGFSTSGTQACARTSTKYTKLAFSSYSGTAPWASYWNGSTYRVYSIHTGDLLITQPILSTEVQPIFTVNAACPTATRTVNWIFVQWSVAKQNNLSNTYFIGTSTIAATTGATTMLTQYDVNGTLVWSGTYSRGLTACSNGQAESTGSGDLAGTLYYAANGSGVYKSAPGRATFFFPQVSINLSSDLGSRTFTGIQFDSSNASANNTVPVQVTSDAEGETFTVKPYSDAEAGTIDASYTDTISITQTNTPANGMLLGTVTRTGTGAGGPTKVACLVHRGSGLKTKVICSGQSPSSSNTPYNVSFVHDSDCPENYVKVPANSDVGTTSDFCVAKYEMKNVGGVATSQAQGAPWVSIRRGTDATDALGAIYACQQLGGAYDLISNAEWQTVARRIEIAYDGSNYVNWSDGTIQHDRFLNRGNSGISQPALAASTDDDPCYGTGIANCSDPGVSDSSSGPWHNKRTFIISTAPEELIWDFAGNVAEWVKDNNASSQGSNTRISQEGWSGGAAAKLKWGPSGTYTAWTVPYGNLGDSNINYNSGAVLRGDSHLNGAYTGVFSVWLGSTTTDTGSHIGFRCVYHP